MEQVQKILQDWIKFIFFGLVLLIGLVIAGILGWRLIKLDLDSKQQNEAASIKTKLEIENLELENKLLELQLKELGFDFTEESKQIEEK